MVTPSSIINSKSDGIVKSEIVKSFDINTDDLSSKNYEKKFYGPIMEE